MINALILRELTALISMMFYTLTSLGKAMAPDQPDRSFVRPCIF